MTEADAMWQSVLWNVERANGEITISASRPTEVDQQQKIVVTFADDPVPTLLRAQAVAYDTSPPPRTSELPMLRLSRFDNRGVIAGELRGAVGMAARFWVDLADPFTVVEPIRESPATIALHDHVIVGWDRLWLQLLDVRGCDSDTPAVHVYLHGIEGPFRSPQGQRDLTLISSGPSLEVTVGSPLEGPSTYRLSAVATCGVPAAAVVTAEVLAKPK